MEAQVKKIDFTDQNIYVGFDAHLNSWKVTVMAEDIVYKTFTQPPKPDILFNYLKKNFPGGNYHSAYEAGFCGFWIHNKLYEYRESSISQPHLFLSGFSFILLEIPHFSA